MRRPAPRPLDVALERTVGEVAPAGLLARVQALWPAVAGQAVATEAEPVAERDGVVSFDCRSSLWAHELELMAPDLRGRLNERLGSNLVRELRFSAASRPPS